MPWPRAGPAQPSCTSTGATPRRGSRRRISISWGRRKLIGEFEFSVCVAGRAQFPICTQSVLLGGHCRVGLEDNLYLEKGVLAKSSAEQVAKIIRIARELGIEPATPDEARRILGLKGLDAVNF